MDTGAKRLGAGAVAAFLAGTAVNLTPIAPSWWLAGPLYALSLVLGVFWLISYRRDRAVEATTERPPPSVPTSTLTTTPTEIWALVNGLTEMQAEQLTKPLLGQLLVVSGTVAEVESGGKLFGALVLIKIPYPDAGMYRSVSLLFNDPKWQAAVSMLRRDDQLNARGTVKSVTTRDILLDDCVVEDA